jgi:hypothetical protein
MLDHMAIPHNKALQLTVNHYAACPQLSLVVMLLSQRSKSPSIRRMAWSQLTKQ